MGYSIPLFDLNFDQSEVEAVAATVRSKWISMGQNTATLEEKVAARLGVKHVVAVTNCTAALHLAMILADLGESDEVIVPSLTFVATVNAVRYVGAQPVFADIVGPHDLSIDPEDIRRKVTSRTRAIVPMHYGGYPCDMDAIMAIAAEHGLRVIEDSAHAVDVSTGQGKCGTIGDIGCFSLFSNKVITCAEGGLLATNDDEMGARARVLRSHGMTTLSYERAKGHATGYDVVDLGFNYRVDDIRSALALAQLEKLDAVLTRRAELRALYAKELSRVRGVLVPYCESASPSANYILPVVLEHGGVARREEVRQRLAADGIQTSVHYPAVHRFSIYHRLGVELPVTEFIADHEITLPMFDKLTADQIKSVVASLESALQ